MHYYFFKCTSDLSFLCLFYRLFQWNLLTRVIDCVKCVLTYAFGDKFMNIFANTMVNGTNLTKNLYWEK